MTNPLAQDLGGVVRLLESVEVPDYVPEHSGLFCSDEDPCNAEGGTHGCERCTWIEIERGQAAATFLRTHSAEIAGALRDAERWQPIESAPRDGRAVILAHMGGKPYIGKWCHDTWVDERGLSRGPSHWRPLPAPPTLESAMQQGGGGGDHG